MKTPHPRSISVVLAFCALQLVALSAHAGCAADPECDAVTDWAKFTSITLDLSQPGKPGLARWRGRFDNAPGDTVIDVDTKGEGGPALKGSVAMVGGYVMLTKGLQLEKGYEIDVLDAPILSMTLVTRLMGREYPRGPASIDKTNRIDRTDKVGIKYATPSAEGYIPAPWHLAGQVSKNADGSVDYDWILSFEAKQPGSDSAGTVKMRMVGRLAMLTEPVLGEKTSLAGWKLYGVGPQETKQGNSTTFDYGAREEGTARFGTIADVRAYIAEEYGPGKPDARRDFTGDWKEKCDQNFGLKIVHFGGEGKYAVVFCGPGGCGDPAQARLTFITGDKAYEVVSDDELLSGRSSKDRYIRCSKDPGEIRPVDR